MSIREFGEQVCQLVKAGLPHELKDAGVYTTKLDIGNSESRTVLLIIRPWNEIVTGFCLDVWYKKYAAGDATVESVVAEIINDRRLYNMSI